MSWLGKFLGISRPPPIHVGVLVAGTLFNANMGAQQLRMFSIDKHPAIKGVAPAFGMQGRLCADRGDGWLPPNFLDPPWILVIPEDAYRHFGRDFERYTGRPIDGRVAATDGLQLMNISDAGMEELDRRLAALPPIPGRSRKPPG